MVRVRVRVESQVELSRVDPQKTQIGSQVNPFLLRIKKIRFGSSIFQVESGQKFLTRFAMSRINPTHSITQ